MFLANKKLSNEDLCVNINQLTPGMRNISINFVILDICKLLLFFYILYVSL